MNEYLRHGKLAVPSHLDLKLQMMVAQELGLTDLARLINEIHKEFEKEQMEMKIAHMTASMGPSQSNRRQDDRRYGGDDRRRSTKGPGPGQGGASDDGWQAVPTRAARVTTERIDTNRIKNIESSKVDADKMSFGPPKGGGGSFGAWGRGSQSGKNSRQEQVECPGDPGDCK